MMQTITNVQPVWFTFISETSMTEESDGIQENLLWPIEATPTFAAPTPICPKTVRRKTGRCLPHRRL